MPSSSDRSGYLAFTVQFDALQRNGSGCKFGLSWNDEDAKFYNQGVP